MPPIKPLDQASEKWVRRASVAGPDYQSGIQSPRRAWAEAAAAGDANYRAGVTAAATAGRYASGVKAAGDAKWRDMALKKGPGRFAEGVAIGKEDWSKGFAPYHAAINALALPARGPKGDPKNIQRVTTVATTLRQLFEKGGR